MKFSNATLGVFVLAALATVGLVLCAVLRVAAPDSLTWIAVGSAGALFGLTPPAGPPPVAGVAVLPHLPPAPPTP